MKPLRLTTIGLALFLLSMSTGCSLLPLKPNPTCSHCQRECCSKTSAPRKPVVKKQFVCNDCMASSSQAAQAGFQQTPGFTESLPPVSNGWAETKSDPRLNMLMMQVSQLEEQRQADDQSLHTLSRSIDSMNKELGGLSAEVKFWKNEVKRVEEETIAQQRADLASFNTLGELVQKLPQASNGKNY